MLRLPITKMNCRGLWQLAVSYRHNYNLLTRNGPDLKFLSESLRLHEISKRSFTREADSKCISPSTVVQWKRFPILNKLLKGHRRGELTVFTGPSGSGKTTFISEYSLDLCMQGVNTLWVNFDNFNKRIVQVMMTQFAQQNLAKNTELFGVYKEQFDSLPMYFMSIYGENNLKKMFEAISHAVYDHNIAHLVLDNLQFMMGLDAFTKQDSIVRACIKLADSMNCHVTLVILPTEEKKIEHMTKLPANNVLMLQGRCLTSVQGKRYLKVLKNGFDGDVGDMLLKFDKEFRSFAAKE